MLSRVFLNSHLFQTIDYLIDSEFFWVLFHLMCKVSRWMKLTQSPEYEYLNTTNIRKNIPYASVIIIKPIDVS